MVRKEGFAALTCLKGALFYDAFKGSPIINFQVRERGGAPGCPSQSAATLWISRCHTHDDATLQLLTPTCKLHIHTHPPLLPQVPLSHTLTTCLVLKDQLHFLSSCLSCVFWATAEKIPTKDWHTRQKVRKREVYTVLDFQHPPGYEILLGCWLTIPVKWAGID